jgi:hypothetical protein
MPTPTFTSWFLGQAKPAADARVSRDLRIDTVRGLALLMIFINHIPQNPATGLTLTSFTLNDAAEIFVLLAGYSATLAYFRGFGKGFFAGAMPVLKRSWTLYKAQLWLAAGMIAGALALAAITGRAFYINHLDLAGFIANPWLGVAGLLSLTYQPFYIDILPIYVVLLALMPLLILVLSRSPALAFTASLGLYLTAQVFAFNLPQVFAAGWFLNPFAWQLLFVAGAMAAHANLTGVALPRSIDGVILAIGALVIGLAIKAPWTNLGFEAGALADYANTNFSIGKTEAHPLRLMTTFALAYLVAALVETNARWLEGSAARFLQSIGRDSLAVFVLGSVLSFLGAAILVETGYNLAAIVAVNLIGLAWLMTWPNRGALWAKTAGATLSPTATLKAA